MKKRILCAVLSAALLCTLGACRKEKNTAGHFGSAGETGNSIWITEETTETEAQTEPGTTVLSEENPVVTVPEDLKAQADGIVRNYGAVGTQAAVIKDGKVLFTYEYGTADLDTGAAVTPDTKYRVASLSKMVTDIVFMAMNDEGLVSETADIGDYLGYTVRNPYYPDDVITPEMLMCHTSSIITTDSIYEGIYGQSSTPIRSILTGGECFAGYRPGEHSDYSNFGLALIGAVCETVAGDNFDVLAHRYVFDPMGIDAAYTASSLKDSSLLAVLYGQGGYTKEKQLSMRFNEPGENYHLVQGNLTVSAKDYAAIIAMLINGGKAENGAVILSEKAAEAIVAEHFDTGYYGLGYGVQLQTNVIEGLPVCVHTGSNYGMFSAFTFSPETGDGVVVLTSGADGSKDNDSEVYNICLDLIRLFFPA